MNLDGLAESVRAIVPPGFGGHYVLAALLGLLVSWLLIHQFGVWYRLCHVPGPFRMSVTNWPMVRVSQTGKYPDYLMELANKYGPIVRIGPNSVMVGDVETIKRMSGVRSTYSKGDFYRSGRLSPPQDNLFSMQNEEERKALKSKMVPGYSGRMFRGFEPGIDMFIHQLIDLIDRKYISTANEFRPIEWGRRAQFFTLDVISYLGLGEALGFLSKDEDLYNYMEISEAIFPFIIVVSNMIWLTSILHKWPFVKLLPREGNKYGFGRLMGLATSIVDARLEPGVKPGTDILQTHIHNGLTRDELIQDTLLFLVTGSDTTATAIRMTLLSLISNPQAYATLQREIDDAIASGAIAPSPAVVTDAQAREMPYLQAVILEGLRLHTPAAGLLHKRVPKGGDVIHGMHLPEGTQVGTNIRAVTRDKAMFGSDAEIFRPERWLEVKDDLPRYSAMREAVDLVFGWGKFVCLGRPLALMELNKVFVELLRRYDFALVDPSNPVRVFNAGLWVIGDFWLRVTKRA